MRTCKKCGVEKEEMGSCGFTLPFSLPPEQYEILVQRVQGMAECYEKREELRFEEGRRDGLKEAIKVVSKNKDQHSLDYVVGHNDCRAQTIQNIIKLLYTQL